VEGGIVSEKCLFCRIVRGELPVTIIGENSHAVAFRDIAPQAPVHILVVPRRHVASLADATEAVELGGVLLLAAAVARSEGISETGYRTVMNTGADGGQTIGHLHAHVLGGRPLTWPPG
jgi:histidine triad (HIT) family protein